jgi:NarL family two-component system sensor histidine kinase LiaS
MPTIKILAGFQRLRWKLTFSYTAVTVAVILTLEIVAMIFALYMGRPSQQLDYFREFVANEAADARVFFETEPINATQLEVQLRKATSGQDVAMILRASGELLAANIPEMSDKAIPGQPFVDPDYPEESRALIDQARNGNPGILALRNGTILSTHPILSEGDEVLGVLYLRSFNTFLIPGISVASMIIILVVSLIVLTIAAGIIGTLFGRITSRGLVHRLESLNSVTEAWGQGDFSATVQDTSLDEIGQLTRRLNQMAKQIQDLLEARQDLATLEERNRLARDLHDSVKQQVFATTMNLGTAKAHKDQDPEAAWSKVDEALDLSWQAQQELSGLIHELRPVAMKGKGLATALRGYGSRWSQQNGIEIHADLNCEHSIPPEVEQALFRLVQEALANVAKHSGAGKVELTLNCTERDISIEVTDDGRGFDPAAAVGLGVGLRSMQERIEALHGELIVESASGKGTRLIARCEWE